VRGLVPSVATASPWQNGCRDPDLRGRSSITCRSEAAGPIGIIPLPRTHRDIESRLGGRGHRAPLRGAGPTPMGLPQEGPASESVNSPVGDGVEIAGPAKPPRAGPGATSSPPLAPVFWPTPLSQLRWVLCHWVVKSDATPHSYLR